MTPPHKFWHNTKYLQEQQYNTPVKCNGEVEHGIPLNCSSSLTTLMTPSNHQTFLSEALVQTMSGFVHLFGVLLWTGACSGDKEEELVWEIFKRKKGFLVDWLGDSMVKKTKNWRQHPRWLVGWRRWMTRTSPETGKLRGESLWWLWSGKNHRCLHSLQKAPSIGCERDDISTEPGKKESLNHPSQIVEGSSFLTHTVSCVLRPARWVSIIDCTNNVKLVPLYTSAKE